MKKKRKSINKIKQKTRFDHGIRIQSESTKEANNIR